MYQVTVIADARADVDEVPEQFVGLFDIQITSVQEALRSGPGASILFDIDLGKSAVLPQLAEWLRRNPATAKAIFLIDKGSHLQRARQVCVPLQPSYSMRCCVLSREGALRALRRLRVINDSADVMLFRHPPPSMRFLDVRPTPVTLTDAGTTQRERWREAPAAPWRPALSWLPRQLALMERIIRRYIAFLRAVGPRGFFRVRSHPAKPRFAILYENRTCAAILTKQSPA